ncbi:hypothetical protein F4811DRAFT_542781 [Daldinia bambusicola]|nr:hypothetical protein F4811DRAFT_542781 [Daldinia bambusicola]
MSSHLPRISGVVSGPANSSSRAPKPVASAAKRKARASIRNRQPSTKDKEMDSDHPRSSPSDSSSDAGGSSGPPSSTSSGSTSEADDDDDGWTSGNTNDCFDIDLDGNGTVFAYPQGHHPQNPLPPQNLTAKEDMLLSHFNELPETLKGVATVFVRQLGALAKKNSDHVSNRRAPVSMVECRSSLPKVRYDEYWSREDEEGLRKRWKKDPVAKKLGTLDVKKNKDILPLWKVVRRFLGCYPVDIINRRSYLRFSKADDEDDGEEDGGEEDTNWPKSFCRRLKSLAVHQVFGFDPNLLTALSTS